MKSDKGTIVKRTPQWLFLLIVFFASSPVTANEFGVKDWPKFEGLEWGTTPEDVVSAFEKKGFKTRGGIFLELKYTRRFTGTYLGVEVEIVCDFSKNGLEEIRIEENGLGDNKKDFLEKSRVDFIKSFSDKACKDYGDPSFSYCKKRGDNGFCTLGEAFEAKDGTANYLIFGWSPKGVSYSMLSVRGRPSQPITFVIRSPEFVKDEIERQLKESPTPKAAVLGAEAKKKFGVKSWPTFAGAEWGSSYNEVVTHLENKGYVLDDEGGIFLKRGTYYATFNGTLADREASIRCDFLDNTLWQVEAKYDFRNDEDRMPFTQRIRTLLAEKYGNPREFFSKLDDPGEFTKENYGIDSKEDTFKANGSWHGMWFLTKARNIQKDVFNYLSFLSSRKRLIISYYSPSYMISQAVPKRDKTKSDEGDF